MLPPSVLQVLSAPTHDVAGISGVAETPRGMLKCKISFGKGPKFEITATVMDGNRRPALLGRDFLRNSAIRSFSISNEHEHIKLQLNGQKTQTAEFRRAPS